MRVHVHAPLSMERFATQRLLNPHGGSRVSRSEVSEFAGIAQSKEKRGTLIKSIELGSKLGEMPYERRPKAILDAKEAANIFSNAFKRMQRPYGLYECEVLSEQTATSSRMRFVSCAMAKSTRHPYSSLLQFATFSYPDICRHHRFHKNAFESRSTCAGVSPFRSASKLF